MEVSVEDLPVHFNTNFIVADSHGRWTFFRHDIDLVWTIIERGLDDALALSIRRASVSVVYVFCLSLLINAFVFTYIGHELFLWSGPAASYSCQALLLLSVFILRDSTKPWHRDRLINWEVRLAGLVRLVALRESGRLLVFVSLVIPINILLTRRAFQPLVHVREGSWPHLCIRSWSRRWQTSQAVASSKLTWLRCRRVIRRVVQIIALVGTGRLGVLFSWLSQTGLI